MITNQRDLRTAFWHQNPQYKRSEMVKMGNQFFFKADIRCAFVDWVDSLARDGQISEALAQRATLER